MRRSPASFARLNLLLIASALSWLALASPAATAGPVITPAPSGAPGSLSITPIGPVDDAGYPNIGVTLSIVDPANGRPETALTAASVNLDPPATVTSVAPGPNASSSDVAAAYVVAVDSSASMNQPVGGTSGTTRLQLAKNLANALMHGLGPKDLVKIVRFGGTLNSQTMIQSEWLHSGDSAIQSTINGIGTEGYGTPLSKWLVEASNVANDVPDTVTRRALVFITDADQADTDANLSTDQLKTQLGPPTFIIGLQPADKVGPKLTQNLSDVATYTGGSYQAAGADTDPTALYKPVLDGTHSTWKVQFSTDSFPDGGPHNATLTVTDAQQRSKTITLTYHSGRLFVISPLRVEGLADGDTVTQDLTVTVSVAGTRHWKDARLDLYLDCDPDHCSPSQTADNAPLVWKLSVASISLTDHHVVFRLTTTDDQGKQYSDKVGIVFTAGGTTWNVAAVFLVGGIAIILIGAFFIASRRRGAKLRRGRATR
ncbi:MAG: VWA domain-containing protein [Candidatus Limnocylindrales bacterium]